MTGSPTPIGTSLPLARTIKRRAVAPLTPEDVALMENPPVRYMANGLTTAQYAELVAFALTLNRVLDTRLYRGKVPGMENNPIPIREASDVTPECLETCEAIFDDWFDNDEPIDWWNFYDRLEAQGWCITDTDCPASRKIQRHIRKHRNQQ
jgi:hypothetical protein